MFVEEVPAKVSVPLHLHRVAAETWFVLKGNFRISVNGEIRELGVGDGLYLAPNVPRAFKNAGDQAGQLLFDVFQVLTNTVTIKVAGADNGGALAMFLEEVPAKAGVPMHVHKGATETLFVLKGRYKISVAGRIRELSEGDGAYLPADVPHAYTNIGSQRGQLLFTIYPSGLDGFFEEISQSGLDPATQLPEINRIAAKYQLEIVGPPLE